MSRRLVAGVDSSTQSCKVVVCDAESGEILREQRAAHPDATEVDPRVWWDAYRQAVADGILDGVGALAVAGQQHGMVALDDQDRPVRDALLWNDTRSAGAAQDLLGDLGGSRAWVDAVGGVPVASFTITKLRWFAQHEPEKLARVRTVVLPHDWLTGLILKDGEQFREWTTDRGDASGTGYWSAQDNAYRRDLLRLAIGREVELPRVLAPDERAGTTSGGLLVAPGTGDNMAASLGLGLRRGDVVISLGTSGTVFADHDQAIADDQGFVSGFASATGGHLPLACTLNAARVLRAGADLLGTDLAGLDDLALRAEPGAGGLTLLPYLDGERTPNLPDSTGLIGGLTRANATPENLARAVVEGMLSNMRFSLEALADHGIPLDRVLLIGGGSRSRAVQALAPTVLGVPVVVPAPGEYVAVGAARQAAWVLTGSLPEWPAAIEAELPAGDESAGRKIREQYAALGAKISWD